GGDRRRSGDDRQQAGRRYEPRRVAVPLARPRVRAITLRLHQSAYEHAQKLIANRRCVLDRRGDWTDHKPARSAEKRSSSNTAWPQSADGMWARTTRRQKAASAATGSPLVTSRAFIAARCWPRRLALASTSMATSNGRPRSSMRCWTP